MGTKTATQTTKKVSQYALNVINTNRALKKETRSLGGSVRLLWLFREEIGLSAQYIRILDAIRKDNQIYAVFKENCRVSKAGNYSPFFVLQAIHKSLKQEEPKPKKRNLTPIQDKTVKELRAIAKKQGLKGYSKMKKEELIEAVTA